MNQIGEWINNDNHFKYFFIFLFFSIKVNAQQYPLDTQLSFVNYNPPTQLPGYLTPIYDENFDTKVTRISAISEFGGIRQDLTHDYSKRQVWNSDQSLISLSYGKILDGKSYELLASAAIGSMGWSNIKPYRNYGTSSNSNYFRVYELNPQTFENRIVFTKTFSEYNRMSHWTAESNLSADDKYVALYGTKSSTGDSCWVIVYNVENDVVVSETNLNTNIANIDWVSMSQSGNYVVVLYKSRGMGVHQGTKSFDRSMNLVKHLTNTTQHGDLGYDQNGNEVWVFYDMGYLKSATLEGGEGVIQYASMQGGHVSCRNINRPGWAYVSDDGDANTPKDYPAFREIFAVKLDGKPNGVTTVNRFTKHYTETNQKYNHYAKTSVSPDGGKVVFNSNMSINAVKTQNFPFAFIVEVDQSSKTILANAGVDKEICLGSSTTLTATGGSTYLWNTGETTASITVGPDETTTYTVTAFDSNGENSDSDEVVVTVNPLPKVNAGSDVTIYSGETVTLTASGAETYRWNTGATTQSIRVSPMSTTTYTVVGTTNGCEASDDVTVFSVEASVKANAGEDVEICSGSSTTLTASGGSTYLWSTGATSDSITVSPNTTTTYSVTVYGRTASNSDSDDVIVTVKPLPIVDAGNDITIEQGESATLTASGATFYKWSNGAEGSSVTVTPASTRTYTVTGTDNGCEAKDTVRVVVLGTVEVIADAGEDQQICLGSSTTLIATGGAAYLWSTGATTSSITVNPNSTTTYSVTAYDATGKFSNTDDVIVTVNPLPVVSAGKNVTIYSGESTILSATGATSYKWSTGATGANVTVSPTATQTYTVTGISNGCEATSTVSVVVLSAVEVIADAGKNQQICEGSSATLTATGGATYLWSTGAKTASITVSPNSTTKYIVTVYDDTGKFSDTDDVTVTVNPLPVVNAGKNITINTGEKTILTATGATSYKWSTGATGSSITVSPTATQTYTVTGTSNGCQATSTVKVTVRTPQKVVASAGKDQDICQGGSVRLTATGGETYLWSTGARTKSITVSPKSTSKYSVTAYVGDVSAKAQVAVNVNANPNVKIANGAETSLLKGERVTLSATGGKSYKWNNGATQPNITVIPNSTQTYKVTGFNDKCAAERSVKVNVLEKVVASAGKDVTIYRNEKTVLTATGPKGSEYLWNTGETTKSITVSPEESTEYSVMVYHALDSDTAKVTVNVIDLVDDDILDDSTNLKFLIHPNPTNGELHVKVSGLTYLSSIHLYDLSGKSLYSEIINESNHHTYSKTLDLSNYASGIYLLQLINNNSVITKKVVLR